MKTMRGWMAAMLMMLAAGGWAKEQVRLDVQVSHPQIKAGEKRTLYIKVGLEGLAPAEEVKRAPINVAIVLDKSGSMSSGGKIEAAREAALTALNMLGKDDIVSIITYDSTVNVLVPATKVSEREKIESMIREIKAGGNTALFAGVSKGAEELRKFLEQERVSRVLLMSDGLANVGPSAPGELGELGQTLAKEGISVSTVGLGLDYNEDLMAQLATRSDGNHFFAADSKQLAGIFEEAMGRAQRVVAQQIKIDIKCEPGVRPVRVLGRSAEIAGQYVRLDLNQLLAGHERAVLLEVEIPAGEAGDSRRVAEATIRYKNALTGKEEKVRGETAAVFTDKEEAVEASVNASVMVPAIQLIAVENNQKAMLLRDQGEIAAAQQVLYRNQAYIVENNAIFKDKKLEEYAGQNEFDASNLGEKEYKAQRKVMVEKQYQLID